VYFTSSDLQAALPANYTFTSTDAGVHTFSVTLKTAGSQSITATDTTTSSITGTQSGITINAASAKGLLVSGFPSPTTAGSSQGFTVTAVDAYGNTVTSYAGTVHFTSTDTKAVLPANYTFLSADAGVHGFTATLKTAGTRSITAKDTVAATVAGTQSGIVVNAAAASSLSLIVPKSSTAGSAFSITVTARDPYGNTATGYTGTIKFTSIDTKAVLPSNYTFLSTDAGVHVFTNGVTLKTTGSKTITATDTVTSTIKGTSSAVRVGAAALDHFKVTGPSTSTAGSAFTVTVTAQDAYNNTVTSYVGTIHFTSTDTKAVLPANYTFTSTDKGVHTFTNLVTLKTAGTQSVTASDTVTTTATGSISVKVNPGKAVRLSISGPSSVTHGVPFTITVTALDAYGNVATGYAGTVHFTSSDGAASLPANYKFTTTDAGVHTFTATLNTAGTQSITATDTVSSTITGTDSGIQVTMIPTDRVFRDWPVPKTRVFLASLWRRVRWRSS
jgi:hypothetical protein